jgi:hypothetical protein
MAAPRRLGWFFAHDWDGDAMRRLGAAPGGPRFDAAGFDLFAFPGNLRLLLHDHERFAAEQAARGRRLGWAGVLSHHEQLGALAAALVAEQMGLPGAAPQALLAAQHKGHARRVLQQVAPEASLAVQPVMPGPREAPPEGIRYPCFVKPVKGAFSVLAREVPDRESLAAMLRFGPLEGWLAHRLVEPFDRICRARLPQAGSAHRMLLEEPVPLRVPQHNLDGWVGEGEVRALGVVDAITYPGTRAFLRWEYPSRLPAAVQARALDVARRFLGAIGFRTGTFNLEFFFDAASDRLSVIECNPRLASQFGDLYRRVDGIDPHAMAVALALGEDPSALPRIEPVAGVAASLVYRAFTPAQVPPAPDAGRRAAFAKAFPDGLLMSMPKRGAALARDFRWTGDHRYGIVHLGAADRSQLAQRAAQASALLGWRFDW